jgi:hypothetical protein
MKTKNNNWLACVLYTITLLALPCIADAERERFEGHRGGRPMEHSHHEQRYNVNRQEAVVHHGHGNVQVHNNGAARGRYYHNGRQYNYYHNGKHYNYYHGGRYYNYYHNGNYYNYFYNGVYYLYFVNGAYYNYYYHGRYYRTCTRMPGSPAMVCH